MRFSIPHTSLLSLALVLALIALITPLLLDHRQSNSRGESSLQSEQVFALGLAPPTNPYQSLNPGIDISYPQCKFGLPLPASSFSIIGLTGGRAFTYNSCVSMEYSWAKKANAPISFYINLNFPSGPSASRGLAGPKGECVQSELACQAFNYGWNAAADAKSYADSHWLAAQIWWLDIETYNTWDFDGQLNTATIQGAIDFLKKGGLTVGIYTAPHMWAAVTDGHYDPQVPIWIAGASDKTEAKNYCGIHIGSGRTWLSQYSDDGPYDRNLVCP